MNSSFRTTLVFIAIFSLFFLPVWFFAYTNFAHEPRLVFRALGLIALGSLFAAALAARYLIWHHHKEVNALLKKISGHTSQHSIQETSPDKEATRIRENISALRLESQRLNSLLDNLGEAVIAIDPLENIVLANQVASSRFSIRCKQRLSDEPVLVAFEDHVREVLWSGEVRFTELSHENKDYSVTMSPTFEQNETQKISGVIILIHDVTKIRKLERIRQDFVANLSHELRTPIAVIQSSAETLSLPAMNLSDIANDFAETIHRHSQRMGNLIESLLRLSQIEAGDSSFTHQNIFIPDLCNDLLENVKMLAEEKNISIKSNFPALSILGEKEGLSVVFQNLIENAIKYSHSESTVTFFCKADKQKNVATFTISDQGIGIDKQHLDRIFERFYRVDEGRSRDVGGTGLGLAIVKHLVRAMEGDIRVESEIGKGTQFYISFDLSIKK